MADNGDAVEHSHPAARRLLALGLFVLGLYLVCMAAVMAGPSAVVASVELWRHIWPDPNEPARAWEVFAYATMFSGYFAITGLSGVSALFASGNLWWSGSAFWARLFAVSGALGSLGQALPGLALSAVMAWDGTGLTAGAIGAVWSSLPSLLFVGLAVGTLIVLGGPREGIEEDETMYGTVE